VSESWKNKFLEGAQKVIQVASEKGKEFGDYVKSPEFETDIDDLASRLGIKWEEKLYREYEPEFQKRITQKLSRLAKEGLSRIEKETGGATTGVRVAKKIPLVGLAVSAFLGGREMVDLAFHVYDVYRTRKK
jgi:hypothetical protein